MTNATHRPNCAAFCGYRGHATDEETAYARSVAHAKKVHGVSYEEACAEYACTDEVD